MYGLPNLPTITFSSTPPKCLTSSNIDTTKGIGPQDIIIMTWTDAEWQALIQVFCTPTNANNKPATHWDYSNSSEYVYQYSTMGPTSGGYGGKYWGSITLATIGSSKICLFKSNLHLQEFTTVTPLINMIRVVLDDMKPSLFITTGTSGPLLGQYMGDVMVTNTGYINVKKITDATAMNNNTYGTGYTLNSTQKQFIDGLSLLKMPMTASNLNYMLDKHDVKWTNETVLPSYNPSFLEKGAQVHIYGPQNPLMTVDTFMYAVYDNDKKQYGLSNDGDGFLFFNTAYSVVEMDDAFIAYVINTYGNGKTDYVSVRSASNGCISTEIPYTQQKELVVDMYDYFGGYGQINGAMVCYAIAAGADVSPATSSYSKIILFSVVVIVIIVVIAIIIYLK